MIDGGMWTAGDLASGRARSELRAQANVAAALHAAVLRSELEKHRSLPFVLAEDPDVKTALARPTAASLRAVDEKLEQLSQQTRAADIYLIDAQGLTRASSNWRLPSSFVGSNYGFRPYFRDALANGAAEFFALGTVSRRPGLYLARRVSSAGRKLGVVVVKVEFDALEAEWAKSDDLSYVTDSQGVVLLSSVPDWRFQVAGPLPDAAKARIRDAQQFGDAPLTPLPIRARSDGQVTTNGPDADARRFIAVQTPAAAQGWTLRLLTPTEPVVGTAATAARAVTLIASGLVALGIGFLVRRREAEDRRAAEREARRQELERMVEARTGELRTTNDRLLVEVEERRRAEATLHTLQDQLVQANKLAVLGQIAAGVAHEINQPVAAIRTYADNAVVMLDRDEPQPARKNLAVIAALTERIGAITGELRAFSRRTTGKASPVGVEQAIAGALLLMSPALRTRHVKLKRTGDMRELRVLGEPIRLEQVLVNLLQNAVEAVADHPSPIVELSVEATRREVRIRVRDNGPGLSPKARAGLFKPFNSTKAAGMGLGLVISRDIVREFDGQLTAERSVGEGATFMVTLRRAT
ncbi:sensor histidine kinase [Phenylobacterium sp.]|uniref:sensor histidine kinase n=1 Tax=Phenylobacterium sp. TaxID=1871053 RepID=UPI002E340383|nr:ATP-binding protein [Phenylobacterium sp.]HEX3367441.1 ATP-binding protein [Phenylobacterium sp.]